MTDSEFEKLVLKTIQEGWEATEEFALSVQCDVDLLKLRPEYLATVKIAEKIKDNILSSEFRDRYSLLFEEKTKDVYTRCFSSEIKLQQTISGKLKGQGRRKINSKLRNGRFDIVIYKNNFCDGVDIFRTYCVIEVKNQESTLSRIINDIERIEEILSISSIERDSSIKFGILTFSRNLTKRFKISDKESNVNFLLGKDLDHIKRKLNISSDKINQFSLVEKQQDYEFLHLKYLYAIYTIIISPHS